MYGSIVAGIHGTIEFRILSEEKFELALEVQQKSMRRENVAQGIGLYEEEGAAEAMRIIFQEVIKDGCTIVAVRKDTEQVVGVSFNKMHVVNDMGNDPLLEVMKNNIMPRSALDLIEFLNDVEAKVDIYEKYNARAAMEIFYVGTDPGYCGHRIGQGVVGASLELARRLKGSKTENTIIPELVFGVFTSNYSQRIAEVFKFDWVETVHYSNLTYSGKTMAERIGDEHKTAKFGVLRL